MKIWRQLQKEGMNLFLDFWLGARLRLGSTALPNHW
jgi:hypothetical protein